MAPKDALTDVDGAQALRPLYLDAVPRQQFTLDADADLIVGFNSRKAQSRPFNLLRGQLLQLAEKRQLRIIGITSATPKVGKSLTAINLAASLSRTPGLRTYLFDFDLRRSSVSAYLRIPNEVGLTEYLDGRLPDLNGCGWSVEDEALSIFPTSPQKVQSAELLAGKRMEHLIRAMRNIPHPAICILDMPPVFANDDALILSRCIDGYVLVIEDGMTTTKQARNAIRLLKPKGFLGSVLNRLKGGLGGDGYGYGYGSKEYSDYYD